MKAKVLLIILIILFIGSLIMTGIVHERVVASRDKGLATDWNADHTITGDVDMDQHSWENQVIENLGAFPGGPVEGQVIWRSDLNRFYVYNGTDWVYYITADGNTPFTGDQSMGGHDLTNVVGISSPINETMLISASGVATLLSFYGSSGITFNVDPGEVIIFLDPVSMGAHKITNLADGTAATDAAALGQIAIPHGTYYWSYPGSGFLTWEPSVDNIFNDADNGVFGVIVDSNVAASAPVVLPHGAVVTRACVYGDTTWNWLLLRDTIKSSGLPDTLASGTRDSCDTSINFATIDNNTYKYWFEVYSLDTDEHIDGAEIRYTL